MENMEIDEVKQLVNFYRQKSYDLEFQLLQSQIELNRMIKQKSNTEPVAKITKAKSE